MNALQVFNYGEVPVRVIDLVGEPWWVLADVCRVLKITNHKNVAARLDEDEKGVHLMDTPWRHPKHDGDQRTGPVFGDSPFGQAGSKSLQALDYS